MIHRCPHCPFSSKRFCKVVLHIRDHRYDNNFSVMCGVNGCAKTYRQFESYRRHLYRQHRSYMDLDTSGDAAVTQQNSPVVLRSDASASELRPDASASVDMAEGDVLSESELLSSSLLMDDTDGEQEVVSSSAFPVGSAALDFKAQMKKHLCLLFFRMTEVHKLPHSTMESIIGHIKVGFRDMFHLFAAKIQEDIHPLQFGKDMHSLLTCDFLDEIFEDVLSKHKREQFAKECLPYTKPEEHVLTAGDTFHDTAGLMLFPRQHKRELYSLQNCSRLKF
ncbi:uncharacterized protein LOC144104919 [Amblyomma americanum]